MATDETIYVGGWSTGNVRPNERLATVFETSKQLREEDLKNCKTLFARLDQNKDGKLVPDEIPAGRAKECFGFVDQNKNGAWEYRELRMLEIFPTARGKNILVAVKPGGEGDVTKSNVLWQKRRGIPYVATPLLYKGRLHYFKKGGFATCLDAKTGKPYYESKRIGVPGEYYATPVGVGNRIYVGTDSGSMVVLGTGDELEVLARIDFRESIVATPAVVENTLYLRTKSRLYAIGSPASRE